MPICAKFHATSYCVILGTVTVPHRLAVGSVIQEVTLNGLSDNPIMVDCRSPVQAKWENSQFPLLSNGYNSIYQTNIDGIGLRFISQGAAFSRDKLPLLMTHPMFATLPLIVIAIVVMH